MQNISYPEIPDSSEMIKEEKAVVAKNATAQNNSREGQLFPKWN
jgi:hypothetical protein